MPIFMRLFLGNFLFTAAHNSLNLLPPYLKTLGASEAFVGFYANINTLSLVLVIVFLGRPLIRLNPVSALRFGFFTLILSYVGMALFPTSLALLVLFKVTGSISFVFGYSMLMNMVYALTPPETRTSTIAVYGVAGLLTNPVTALLGEVLARNWGGPSLFLLGLAFSVGAFVLTFFLKLDREPLERHEPDHFIDVVQRRELIPLFLLGFLFGSAYSVWMSFLPNYTKSTMGEANLTAFSFAFAAVSVGIRLFFAKFMDNLPSRLLLTVASTAMLASFTLVLFAHSIVVLAFVGAIYGFAHSILFPLLSSTFVRSGSEQQKSAYNNAFIVLSNLGAALVVPFIGWIGDLFGYGALFSVMIGASAICLALNLKIRVHGTS